MNNMSNKIILLFRKENVMDIVNTECGKCCYVQCGMDADKEKECHCDNQEGHNCYSCKCKSMCF